MLSDIEKFKLYAINFAVEYLTFFILTTLTVLNRNLDIQAVNKLFLRGLQLDTLTSASNILEIISGAIVPASFLILSSLSAGSLSSAVMFGVLLYFRAIK